MLRRWYVVDYLVSCVRHLLTLFYEQMVAALQGKFLSAIVRSILTTGSGTTANLWTVPIGAA
jgi:hypothetical protein